MSEWLHLGRKMKRGRGRPPKTPVYSSKLLKSTRRGSQHGGQTSRVCLSQLGEGIKTRESNRSTPRRSYFEGIQFSDSDSDSDSSYSSSVSSVRSYKPRVIAMKTVAPLPLPPSSDDIILPPEHVLQGLGIYEVLRQFGRNLRLSPFRFEDFCAAIDSPEQSALLSQIHMALFRALLQEDETNGYTFAASDEKDSLNIFLHEVDCFTWPEHIRSYFFSDKTEFGDLFDIIKGRDPEHPFPFVSISDRLKVLQRLCDLFLASNTVREVIINEGIVESEDHCRNCSKMGDLLCCETCPAVYHLHCLKPPLEVVPEGDWLCPICDQHQLRGVTDCQPVWIKDGWLRHTPLGTDRQGRKYWFLSRRLFVESEDELVLYYSSKAHLDELIEYLEEDGQERRLLSAIKTKYNTIIKQMAITESLIEASRGDLKSGLLARRKKGEKQNCSASEADLSSSSAASPKVDLTFVPDTAVAKIVTKTKEEAGPSSAEPIIDRRTAVMEQRKEALSSDQPMYDFQGMEGDKTSEVIAKGDSEQTSTSMEHVKEECSTSTIAQPETSNERPFSHPQDMSNSCLAVKTCESNKQSIEITVKSENEGLKKNDRKNSSEATNLQEAANDSKENWKIQGSFVASNPFANSEQQKTVLDDTDVRGPFFRLGMEDNFSDYVNHFATDPLALNRLQHMENKERRRAVSNKFSVFNEFKVSGEIFGPKDVILNTLRCSIVNLENNIPAAFMHPAWPIQRSTWVRAVHMSTTPVEFAAALCFLESLIKPVCFLPVWNDSLGHTELHRAIVETKAEKKKREHKDDEEDVDYRDRVFVNYSWIPIHQIWKQKGEEYRIFGGGGWTWESEMSSPKRKLYLTKDKKDFECKKQRLCTVVDNFVRRQEKKKIEAERKAKAKLAVAAYKAESILLSKGAEALSATSAENVTTISVAISTKSVPVVKQSVTTPLINSNVSLPKTLVTAVKCSVESSLRNSTLQPTVMSVQSKPQTPQPTTISVASNPKTPQPKAMGVLSTTLPTIIPFLMSPVPQSTVPSHPVMSPLPQSTAPSHPVMTPVPQSTALSHPVMSPVPQSTAPSHPVMSPVPQSTAPSHPVMSPVPQSTAPSHPVMSPVPQSTAASHPVMSPVPQSTAPSHPVMSPVPQSTAPSHPLMSPVPQSTAPSHPVMSPVPQSTAPSHQVMSPVPQSTALSHPVMPPVPQSTAPSHPVMSPVPQSTAPSHPEMTSIQDTEPNVIQRTLGTNASDAVQTVPDIKPADVVQSTPNTKLSEGVQIMSDVEPSDVFKTTPDTKSCELVQTTLDNKPTEMLQPISDIKPLYVVQTASDSKPFDVVQRVPDTKPDVVQTVPNTKLSDVVQTMPEPKPAKVVQILSDNKLSDVTQTMSDTKLCDLVQIMPDVKLSNAVYTTPDTKPCDLVQTTPDTKPLDVAQTMPDNKPCDVVLSVLNKKPSDAVQVLPDTKMSDVVQTKSDAQPFNVVQATSDTKMSGFQAVLDTKQCDMVETMSATKPSVVVKKTCDLVQENIASKEDKVLIKEPVQVNGQSTVSSTTETRQDSTKGGPSSDSVNKNATKLKTPQTSSISPPASATVAPTLTQCTSLVMPATDGNAVPGTIKPIGLKQTVVTQPARISTMKPVSHSSNSSKGTSSTSLRAIAPQPRPAILPATLEPGAMTGTQGATQITIPIVQGNVMQGTNVLKLTTPVAASSGTPVSNIAALVASLPANMVSSGQPQLIRFVTPSGATITLQGTIQPQPSGKAGKSPGTTTSSVPKSILTSQQPSGAQTTRPVPVAPKTVGASTGNRTVILGRPQQPSAAKMPKSIMVQRDKYPVLEAVVKDPRKLLDRQMSKWRQNRYSMKSVYQLPKHRRRIFGRRAGMKEMSNFMYVTRGSGVSWAAGFPRPNFKVAWRYRTQSLRTLAGAGLQARILHACLKWDDINVRPPRSNSSTICTSTGTTTTEIINHRYVTPDGLHCEFLVRKIVRNLHKPVAEAPRPPPPTVSKRGRILRPKINLSLDEGEEEDVVEKGPRVFETWCPEEKLELWEIRQYHERKERERALEREKKMQEEALKRAAELRAAAIQRKQQEQQAKQQQQIMKKKVQNAIKTQQRKLTNVNQAVSRSIVNTAFKTVVPTLPNTSQVLQTSVSRQPLPRITNLVSQYRPSSLSQPRVPIGSPATVVRHLVTKPQINYRPLATTVQSKPTMSTGTKVLHTLQPIIRSSSSTNHAPKMKHSSKELQQAKQQIAKAKYKKSGGGGALNASRKSTSLESRQDMNRMAACHKAIDYIISKIERNEELEKQKEAKRKAVMEKQERAKAVKLDAILYKRKEILKKEIIRKRSQLERELTIEVEKELGKEQKSAAARKRKRDSEGVTEPPLKNIKKQKTEEVYCFCRKPYDETKFYIGCDLCANWFHGSCVGVTPEQAVNMDDFTCMECSKAQKGVEKEELYCLCKQPYDETKFYIGCDTCHDWFHGTCVGVSEYQATFITSYVCPRCKENQSRRDVQPLAKKDLDSLKRLLRSLQSHKMAWPFLEPVNGEEVVDYYDVIKDPMDLSKVEDRLTSNYYKTLEQFNTDITTIFDNCRLYNSKESPYYRCAEVLEGFFVKKLRSWR